MEGHEEELSCISEGAAFMSDKELVRVTEHPYKKSNYATHGHFLPTEIVYPPYSFPARPFAWMMKDRIAEKIEQYGIDFDYEAEPRLNFNTTWVQDAGNHRAIFDCFYSDIIPNESLCVAYAKQVPFVEDSRRVVVAMGHVKKVVPAVEHAHTDEKPLRSMTWETHICHSIREDHEDGFVIPYQKMMEYANENPDFDLTSITVFAPDDAFEQFSYASEHLTHDAVIEVILSCIRAFEIINNCLDEDYSNVLDWLNAQLAATWEDRGAFPGLGSMFCALEIPLGILVAKELKEQAGNEGDFWGTVDAMFDKPSEWLPDNLAKNITPIVRKTWKSLSKERRTLFELLSRFSLSIGQAKVFFNESRRTKEGIICTDKEIIENPYILYERTRLKISDLYISVKKVDMAIFPVASIAEKYPVLPPTMLTSDNDERRIRAIAVAVLEDEINRGNTILPCHMLVGEMQAVTLKPECKVTEDILIAAEKHLSPEIMKREMKDGTEYYKLRRINEFDEIIEKRIRKRLKRENRLKVDADWNKMLINKFGVPKTDVERDGLREKEAVLKELSCSRIGVLVGDAGTGKTTVLSILCTQHDIKAGGVLLLAPTGKATVRLMESMEDAGKDFESLNVAQFLVKSKRFNWKDMRYTLSGQDYRDVPETVIIDEASMLTEEMFGALMEALRFAKRIIFVGDPNQLPPIGAGRPFVDLVRILREELNSGAFPKVCNCYGELTINFRQQSAGERLDVELSKYFTDTSEPPEEDIISAIEKGESKHIRVVRWNTKEELEEKILDTLVSELKLNDVDDVHGFDLALGGTQKDYGIFFDIGCAEAADKWQILAPVRNMPQGVMNINRLIHLKYRERFLETSKRWGKYKRIPRMLGPENIVYGDKVINVTNMSREAWPKDDGARNYIANGEVGITCASYSVKKPNDYLHVEFSSQKGYNYSYDKKDFDDENGTANLELAYALTVHKAQGSQFDTVILVLAEPCQIISRELLYTALTRQKNKIVILYNQETYHLMNYASAANSDIARRFTDLFADVFTDIDTRPNIVECDGKFFEEGLIHKTIQGEMVRSKSEVAIADCLHYNGVPYEYEKPLELEGRIKRPDFTITDPDTDQVWYWEHCGMMTDPKYRKRWEDKKAFYAKCGIREGENLIVTYDDEKGGLDTDSIDTLIKQTFDF
jgi:ATP-dependent exoDNAse (exonuclease V) alpha subunit